MPVETPDLIAATLTPLKGNGDLNLDAVGPLVENLLADGVRGLYVNGSTGEGV
ncbi:MAG: dihydrodipicolinate synthase family protein, partial [bacterium]|nr:dihydrodipicolinate synthase family protein [bacterium]